MKFRGETQDGKLVEGYYLETGCGRHFIIDPPQAIIATERTFKGKTDIAIVGCYEVLPQSLAMSTGISDKNQVEIFGSIEVDGVMSDGGDDCKLDISGDGEEYNPIEALIVVIEWKNGGWGFRHRYPLFVCPEDRVWRHFWNQDDEEMWDSDYFEILPKKEQE